MITRNFWLEADIDGRATRLQGGPAGTDGGFTATVYVRCEDIVVTTAHVAGTVSADGKLELRVTPEPGDALPDGVTVVPLPDGGFVIRSRR